MPSKVPINQPNAKESSMHCEKCGQALSSEVEVALQKKSEMKRKRAKAQVAWESYCEVLPRTAAIWMFVVMALLVALIFATRNSSLGEFATNVIGMCILVAGIWTLFKYNEKQLIIQKAKFARNHPDLYEVLFGPLGDQPVG